MISTNTFPISCSKFAKQIGLFIAVLFCGYNSFAQAPVNDDPCNATTLTVGATCTYQNFTTVNATPTAGLASPGCAGVQFYDVWFQVVVPAGGTLIFDTQTGTITDGGMAIYSGTCSAPVLIECDDDDSPNGNMPMITRSGLTVGSTILIRFWRYSASTTPAVFGTFGICVSTPPPPPVNDNCATPTPAPVNPAQVCTQTVTGTTASATPTTGVPAPTCSATGANDDVWYSFVAGSSTHSVTLSNVAGTTTGMAMQVYGGTCGALIPLQCIAGNSITVSNLVPTQTYLIRVYTSTATAGLYANFTLCITTPPPPPVNDDPCAAITLNAVETCTYQTFTTVSATNSTGFPAPGCANFNGSDVWFQTTVPAGGAITINSIEGGITDGGMAIYRGDCNSMILIDCDDDGSPNGAMPMIEATGLNPGSTIFIRFWEYGGDANGTFGICVTIPPPPPANDDPCTAITLTANATCVFQEFTNASATPTSGVPAPGCANYSGGDVWFQVVVPAGGAIRVTTEEREITDGGMAVYSGATCSNLTLLECSDDVIGLMPQISVGGLTPGSTVWVRVWEYGGDETGTFGICVTIPPPPPANDNPCDAIPLPIAENGACNFQQFTNESATGTTGVPAPGCAGYSGGDVWFTAVVPCSGALLVDTRDVSVFDGGMAIYRGSCSNLSLIACDDDGSSNGAMPRIYRNDFVPGETVWIRFWENGNNNNGTFEICAQAPPPPPPAATCQTAQSFCTSSTPTTVPNITGQPNTNGGGVYGCLLTIPNPTYYYLQIQNSGSIQITISQTSTAGNPEDVDFVVWGPFNNLNATCTGISASNIIDCGYSTSAVEVVDIPNAVAGQFYLFLVTNFSDEPGTITYQQTGGTGSSNCAITCTLSASNSGPICSGAQFNLTATTVANATYQWTGPNCFSSTQQNPTVTTLNAPITPGQYVYTVTATTPSGQACQDTTIVTVSAKPVLAADTSFKICAGSTANLTTIYNTTNLTNAWTLGGVAVANPAAVNVTGVYRLISANATGCTDTAFVNLTVDTVRSETSVAQIICTQTARIAVSNLSGIAPYEYSISSNPGVFQSSNEFVVPGGNYAITTRDSLGCTTTNQVTVTIVPEISVNAGPDVSIVTGETTQLIATVNNQPSSILWTPSTGLNATNVLNPKANPTATTTYRITVTNSQGCEATDDVVVTVIPYCVKVENAFTPNGDGINDLWKVYDSYECLKNVTVHVFNRYGKKVYESKDYRNNWQGTYDGKPIPDGTYYAVADFIFLGGKKVTVKTDLTILR